MTTHPLAKYVKPLGLKTNDSGYGVTGARDYEVLMSMANLLFAFRLRSFGIIVHTSAFEYQTQEQAIAAANAHHVNMICEQLEVPSE